MIFWLALLGCAEERVPDAIWDVEVTGLETTCIDSLEGYQEKFRYEAFFEGSLVQLDIDGETFATGQRRGCHPSTPRQWSTLCAPWQRCAVELFVLCRRFCVHWKRHWRD